MLLICVLVWAGKEFTFFTVAGTGLWFGSVLKTVLIESESGVILLLLSSALTFTFLILSPIPLRGNE